MTGFANFVKILFCFSQKQSGFKIKLMKSKIVFMIGPIGFVLTGIASLVSLWAYFEKVVSP